MTKLLKIGLTALLAASLGTAACAQGPGYTMPTGHGAAGWQTRAFQSGDPAVAARVTNLRQNIYYKERQLLAARAAGQDTSGLEAQVEGLRHWLQATVLQSGPYFGAGPYSCGATSYGTTFYPGLGGWYGVGPAWQGTDWSSGDPAVLQRIAYLQQMLRGAIQALRVAELNGWNAAYLQDEVNSLYSELQATSLQAGVGLGLGPWSGGRLGGPGWGAYCPNEWQPR